MIEPFARAYVAGETPVPCVACNQYMKFADLFAAANDLGADLLATGHYVVSRDEEREDGRSSVPPTRIATKAISCSPPPAPNSLGSGSHWGRCRRRGSASWRASFAW